MSAASFLWGRPSNNYPFPSGKLFFLQWHQISPHTPPPYFPYSVSTLFFPQPQHHRHWLLANFPTQQIQIIWSLQMLVLGGEGDAPWVFLWLTLVTSFKYLLRYRFLNKTFSTTLYKKSNSCTFPQPHNPQFLSPLLHGS